jgi:hypothetical protein
MAPAQFAAMYPEASKLTELRNRIDPRGTLVSDLSRRLELR